ncbi:hypothetical protein QC761_511669 [Podospora bellae-mahoneyi]|uniref:Uncharacterized protein n=1 Tax=Podospora bellae-mahoneyi TaxID=2093777 RepID=A0ABR0FG39_9PEZI|nr:hypothetical protein QC761_511669 [Podospora bellae-mahoneyi]
MSLSLNIPKMTSNSTASNNPNIRYKGSSQTKKREADYIPPKRFYVTLPQIALDYAYFKDNVTTNSILRRWNPCLRASLSRHRLGHYLTHDGVPPPNNDPPARHTKDWRNDCFDIIELILASVQGMVLDMSNKGWYPLSEDLRHHDLKVFETFGLNEPEDL